MNDLFDTILKFAMAVGMPERVKFFETIVMILARCAEEIENKDTPEFRAFTEVLAKDQIIVAMKTDGTPKIHPINP